MTERPARTGPGAGPAGPAHPHDGGATPWPLGRGPARALQAVPARSRPQPSPPPALRLVPAPSSLPPYDDGHGVAARLRLVHDAGTAAPASTAHRPGDVHHEVPGPQPDLPDARPFAHALVQRLLEVRGGVRPVLQLQRHTTPTLFADLERDLVRRALPAGPRPTGRDIRSVHVQQRSSGVAEVCATVRRGDRMAALALRLEAFQGQWLCTQVQGL